MPFMTTAELLLHLTCHIGNLNLLKQRYSELRPADKARAEWTMANLMEQVYAIDEELQMAGTA